jgi:ketosteroid isomerase-like protein
MTVHNTQEAATHIRGLIERWTTSVREQDIDGVLADHAEDMVM